LPHPNPRHADTPAPEPSELHGIGRVVIFFRAGRLIAPWYRPECDRDTKEKDPQEVIFVTDAKFGGISPNHP